MQVTEISDKLNLVALALAANDLIPVYKCLMFDEKNVAAFNDTISIVTPLKTWEFAVDGSTLLKFLGASSGELEIKKTDDHVSFTVGKSTLTLPFFEKKDFLYTHPNVSGVEFSLPVEKLEGLEACLVTSANDLARPMFMGVALVVKDGKLLFYSCDGDRLTRYLVDDTDADDMQILMPDQFCSALLKLRKAVGATGINLYVSPDWIQASVGEFTINGRVTSSDVNYEELIQSTGVANEFHSVPDGMLQAMSRARVISDRETTPTKIDIRKGVMSLTTSNHLGDMVDQVVYNQAPCKVSVSAELVQKAIAKCDEMVVLDNCTAYRKGDALLMIVGNME